ncbi:MAG: box helicase, ATP-dependent helicase RhlE [Candidatus Parcubacteria bacterium]|nr:box helicase, ATP-dependent helicase RhlE [Candidatus Parcubacteria bacterium]
MNTRNNYGGPKRSFAHGSRSSGSRPASRSRNAPGAQYINPARFVNKVIVTEEVEVFTPEHSFQDFHIDERLKAVIAKKGYVTPTPIQDKAIPHVLMGSDVVGIANTGTGKTAAFLLPLIHKVLGNPKMQVMIVAPTRELAVQIDAELKTFTPGMKIFSVCGVGGANIVPQMRALRYHNNFVIGTPGRLKDLIDRRLIDLSKFTAVVLDEADRMLDMGFINDMKALMAGMPKERQTLFFSATLSPDIEKLIGQFLRTPVRVSVKTRDTSKTIDQDVIKVPGGVDKLAILQDLLKKEGFDKILIFGRTKHGVDRLSRELAARGFKAESIHGDKNYSRRIKALQLFKDNHIQILVATDVAARGLDIPNVSHVINFDTPATYEDYVHRIGRTGRGGKQGKALTFVS